MEEIKIGEYIRTELGDIIQITEGFEFIIELHNESNNKIVKHSKNIIDLIEVGDYVNGKKISNVDKIDNTNVIEWEDGDIYKTTIQNDNFIKSIVTKERFESIKYEVE